MVAVDPVANLPTARPTLGARLVGGKTVPILTVVVALVALRGLRGEDLHRARKLLLDRG